MSSEDGVDVVVRPANRDDIHLIFRIFQDTFRLEAPSEARLLGFYEQFPGGMLVAQMGDKVAGCTVAFVRNGRPHLYGTVACPEFRTHRGIGSGLVASQLSNFQKLGYTELETIIRCDNSISIKTAVRLGFKHVRTMRDFFNYPRKSARLYVRSLSEDRKLSIDGPTLKDKAKELWARVVEPRRDRRLQVAWFDSWQTVLDNALHELPEMENCPPDLFRLIMQNPSSADKRTALVMEGDRAVAVVGLRQKGRYWVPAMQGIIPGCVAPARDEYLFLALNALGVDVRIGDWPAPPPESAHARSATAVPVFNIDCQSDYEQYWRKSHYMETVRDARKRTEGFTFDVDRPGSAALTIANWARKWQDHPDQQTIIASDLAVAAEYCEQRDQWHSFLLLDGDVPVAGVTGSAHGSHLALTVSFRDQRYDRRGVGVRILDLITQWAAERGLAKVGLGGWYSYKARWAPQDGEHWDLRICPFRQHVREQVIWKARAVPSKLRALVGWLPGMSRTPRADDSEEVAGRQQEAPETESGDAGPVPSPIAGATKGRRV